MTDPELDVLRDVQLKTAAAPFTMMRGSFSGWLLVEALESWPHSARSGVTLRLLFIVVGLRLAGWVLRRRLRVGYALSVLVLVLGFLPSLATMIAGASSMWWLYAAIVAMGGGLGGVRAARAVRDLERYGASAPTERRVSPPA